MPRGFVLERDAGSLKDATKNLIEEIGTFGQAAECCRLSRATLERYANPRTQYSKTYLPVDVVEELERAANEPIITAYLADKARHLLIPMPPEESSDVQLNIDLAKTGEQVAQLCHEWAVALENDDIIDSDEAEVLLKRLQQLVAVLMRMRADLEARAAQGIKAEEPSALTPPSETQRRS